MHQARSVQLHATMLSRRAGRTVITPETLCSVRRQRCSAASSTVRGADHLLPRIGLLQPDRDRRFCRSARGRGVARCMRGPRRGGHSASVRNGRGFFFVQRPNTVYIDSPRTARHTHTSRHVRADTQSRPRGPGPEGEAELPAAPQHAYIPPVSPPPRRPARRWRRPRRPSLRRLRWAPRRGSQARAAAAATRGYRAAPA